MFVHFLSLSCRPPSKRIFSFWFPSFRTPFSTFDSNLTNTLGKNDFSMSSIQCLIVCLFGGALGSSILRTGNEQLRVAETKLVGAADNKADIKAMSNQSFGWTLGNITLDVIDETSGWSYKNSNHCVEPKSWFPSDCFHKFSANVKSDQFCHVVFPIKFHFKVTLFDLFCAHPGGTTPFAAGTGNSFEATSNGATFDGTTDSTRSALFAVFRWACISFPFCWEQQRKSHRDFLPFIHPI